MPELRLGYETQFDELGSLYAPFPVRWPEGAALVALTPLPLRPQRPAHCELIGDAVLVDESWQDPEQAWWAKLRRAQLHIDDASTQLDAFMRLDPWSAEADVDPKGDRVSYRLRVHHPVPQELVTTVGDAIHNLRSSLEAVAFGLARSHIAKPLTEPQEEASTFPIRKDPEAFEAFFRERGRGTLFGDAERAALRCVQPFALSEEAAALGIETQETPEESLRHDTL
jgi:hypothetical protein